MFKKIFGGLFGKRSKKSVGTGAYVERDTKCDLCDFKNSCDLVEITRMYDNRQHFVPMRGFKCKK